MYKHKMSFAFSSSIVKLACPASLSAHCHSDPVPSLHDACLDAPLTPTRQIPAHF